MHTLINISQSDYKSNQHLSSQVVEFFVESGQIDHARSVITALLQIPVTRNRIEMDCVLSLLNIRLLQIHTVDCRFFEVSF